MIVGIGSDLVEVNRIERLLVRHPARALNRLFTPGEVARCECVACPAESFAARFAAKEAVFKALGTGWGLGVPWTDIEVLNADSGAPSLRLTGRALELAAGRGASIFHVSLTHTDELASAFVVLEGQSSR